MKYDRKLQKLKKKAYNAYREGLLWKWTIYYLKIIHYENLQKLLYRLGGDVDDE